MYNLLKQLKEFFTDVRYITDGNIHNRMNCRVVNKGKGYFDIQYYHYSKDFSKLFSNSFIFKI